MGILYNSITPKVMKGKFGFLYYILYSKNDEHKIEGKIKNWDFLRLYFILPKMMKGKSKKNLKTRNFILYIIPSI
jgi:hypothetical protein